MGTGAAIEYLAELSGDGAALRERITTTMQRLQDEEAALFRQLVDGLRDLPNVTLYEPPSGSPRHPTVAFHVADIAAADAARQLSDEHALFLSHGNFYAATAVARLVSSADAVGGVLRAGLAMYSTPDEISRLLEALATLRA